MPRDIHGKPVKGEAAEPMRAAKAEERKSDEAADRKGREPHAEKLEEHEKRLNAHDGRLDNHHDRMARLEEHLGIAHKASGMKPEDQGGKDGKIEAGHVTEKAGNIYTRRRS
jgi:hypothetical protein